MMADIPLNRIKAILDVALGLDEPERTAYLEAMCEGDAALYETIQDLLDGSGPVENFLSAIPSNALGGIIAPRSPESTMPQPFAGNDQFEIVRLIARGGSGQVFEAFDRSLGIRVALKVLHNVHPELVDRFKRGWRSVGTLAHRNLCRIYQFFYDDKASSWLLSMELVEGERFDSYLRSNPGRVRESFFQLAQGLQALHAANICHGDVKPSNVLVTTDGRIVVLDFGLSNRLDMLGTGHVPVALTPKYAAPELFVGRPLSSSSDWYSFGVMLEDVLASVSGEHRKELSVLSQRLLDRNPTARPSAAEVLRSLAPAEVHIHIRRDDAPFVGRDEQVGQIQRLFQEQVLAGRIGLIHLSGISGIGKTTFAQHTLQLLRSSQPGLKVLAGRCYQGESVPFKAVDEIAAGIASLLDSLPVDEARLLLPPNATSLPNLFPVFGQALRRLGTPLKCLKEPVDPGELRREAFAAVCALVTNLARRFAVAIFIDDVQWGDLDSARLLAQLITAAPAVLLILAFRTEVSIDVNECLEYLQEAGEPVPITLGVLDREQSMRLAASLLGSSFPMNEAAEIAGEAGGNPFFIVQLTSSRRTGGALSLEEVIQERAASLAPMEQRSLEVLAIARAPLSLAVLRDAAQLGDQVRFIRSGLDARYLIRSLGTSDEAVLPYHDRIAEVLLEAIPPVRRREIHKRIALALEARGNPDAERTATHFHSAGEMRDACRLGRLAAQRSCTGLAFERAAALYAKVLEWGAQKESQILPDVEIADLEEARGQALVNCGRGLEAARAFQRAMSVAGSDHTSLRMRSASELLRAGEISEGLAELKKVLRQHGLPFPRSRKRAIALYIRERVLLALRLRFSAIKHRAGHSVAANERGHLTVCWAAASGTSMVYPLLAEIYWAMYLRLALKSGGARELALGLASHASRLAYVDDGEVRNARPLMALAFKYAETDGTPYVLAVATAMSATIEGLNGNWRQCLEEASRSELTFRTQCIGVAWEIATVSTYLFTSRVMLGEWTEHTARFSAFLDWARGRGDRYAEITATLVSAAYTKHLVNDEPDLAEREINRQLASWPHGEGFDIQQLYAFQSLVNLDLYRANAESAWDRISRTWPEVKSSGLLRLTLLQTFLEDTRARAALALAARAERKERKRLCKIARRASRCLLRCKARYAPGLAHLLSAGIAILDQDGASAADHLKRAELSFQTNELIPWLAVTRLALSEYLTGAEKEQITAAGLAWMNSQKIRRPECLVKMLFPLGSFSA